MKEQQENEEQIILLAEYRSFEELKGLSNEQILEIDEFLRSYAELAYNCFSRLEQKANLIEIDFDRTNLKAA
jgi:hypothetical protein